MRRQMIELKTAMLGGRVKREGRGARRGYENSVTQVREANL